MEHQRDHREHTVGDYVGVLRRRKWPVLIALVVVPAVLYTQAASKPKLFSASADVLLTGSVTGISNPLSSDASSIVQTQTQIATSPNVAERVLKAARITSRSAGQLLGEVGISQVGTSDVLRISIKDADPELAAKLANAYAHEYTNFRRELDSAFIGKARKELAARMKALRAAGDTHSQVYTSLAEKDQQLLTVQALETASAFVIRAAGRAVQVQPRPFRSTMLGVIAGLLLGTTLALLIEALDTRVRNAREVSNLLGQPLIGRITAPPKHKRRDQLVMITDPSGPAAEAFRLLRTNLAFVTFERDAKVVMVTSPTQSEGKSTTAANLAISIARAGRKCILVELDLRRPSFTRLFELEAGAGLTSVALGQSTLDDAILRVMCEDGERVTADNVTGLPDDGEDRVKFVEILPAGPIPPDPGEFVTTNAVRTILDSLRDQADIIIVDTPPLLGVGDAASLSGLVDGILLVVRMGVTKRPILREMHRILEQMPVPKLGFVLTGAEREESYTSEHYGYYYNQPAVSDSRRDRPTRSGRDDL